MALAPGIRLVNVPKRFGNEDIGQYADRLAAAMEQIRDTIRVLEDTGLFRDTARRIVTGKH